MKCGCESELTFKRTDTDIIQQTDRCRFSLHSPFNFLHWISSPFNFLHWISPPFFFLHWISPPFNSLLPPFETI